MYNLYFVCWPGGMF